jgi:hypothetical protein
MVMYMAKRLVCAEYEHVIGVLIDFRTDLTKTTLSSSSLTEVLTGCCVIMFTSVFVWNVRSTNAIGEVFDTSKRCFEHGICEAGKEETA